MMTEKDKEFPTNVELDEEDQRLMKKLNDDTMAVQQFVRTVQEQGEARLSAIQGKMRETWTHFSEKYGLDLETVSYNLSQDGKLLVPTAVRLKKD